MASQSSTTSSLQLNQLEKKPNYAQGQAISCPRCDSLNTKFCYYNNYSFSQPRYFCKGCRRYWTKGGTLRNVPIGGGCKKNKKTSSSNKETQESFFIERCYKTPPSFLPMTSLPLPSLPINHNTTLNLNPNFYEMLSGSCQGGTEFQRLCFGLGDKSNDQGVMLPFFRASDSMTTISARRMVGGNDDAGRTDVSSELNTERGYNFSGNVGSSSWHD